MPNPNPSPQPDPEVLTRFQNELARAAALPGLASAGPALWPRFAGYYQGLARLPRKARRALQRRWRRSLGGLALLLALGQAPALAATINVGGACTLVDAIRAANGDAPAGGCTAGSGADTLILPAGSIHTLTPYDNIRYYETGLLVTSAITIAGNGSTMTREPTSQRFHILQVNPTGDLTLQETTVSGGNSPLSGGGGGIAIYGGTLTLTNSTVSGNDGRGVDNSGTATLTNTTVSGNNGGGVRNSGTLTLTNSTVSGNSETPRGGGANNSGTLTLTNSTVSGNTAANVGGGLFNSGQATLTLSLASGNTAPSSLSDLAWNFSSARGSDRSGFQ